MSTLKSKKSQICIISLFLIGFVCEFYMNGCSMLFLALPRMYIILLLMILAMIRIVSADESFSICDIDNIGQYSNFILLYGLNISFNLSLMLIAFINAKLFWSERADVLLLSLSLFLSSVVHLLFLKRAFRLHVFIYASGLVEQALKYSNQVQTILINCLYIILQLDNFYLLNFIRQVSDSRHKYIKHEIVKDLFFFLIVISQFTATLLQQSQNLWKCFFQQCFKIMFSLFFIVKVVILNYLNFEYLEGELTVKYVLNISKTKQAQLFIQITISIALILFYIASLFNAVIKLVQIIRSQFDLNIQQQGLHSTSILNNQELNQQQQQRSTDNFSLYPYFLELRRRQQGIGSTGLSEKQICKIPVIYFKVESEISSSRQTSVSSIIDNQSTNALGESNLCPICYLDINQMETVYSLKCKHHYHTDCLKPWLKTQNSCPSCRTPVVTNSI